MQTIINKSAYLIIFAYTALSQNASAATYYVDAIYGLDSASGTTSASAWKTLDKVNTATLVAGDTVLFANGGTWEGTLQLKSNVSYSNYGTAGAANPVIRGSTAVTSWSLYKDKIYVADASAIIKDEVDVTGMAIAGGVNQLFLDGVRLSRARYPNIGGGSFGVGKNRYLKIQTVLPTILPNGADANPALTIHPFTMVASDYANIPSGVSLIGAEIYTKNYPWFLGHYNVTAQTGSTLQITEAYTLSDQNYSSVSSAFSLTAGSGYWMENQLWMLNQSGEWCYDAANKKIYLRMPDDSSPNGRSIFAAVKAHAIQGNSLTSTAISNLTLQETRGDALLINKTTQIQLQGLSVKYAGDQGILVRNSGGTTRSTVSNVVVTDSQGTGINLGVANKNIDVTGSTVRNAGIGHYAWSAILLGDGSQALNNTIENVSHIGIRSAKHNVVTGNLIKNACMEFNDCGALYTWGFEYNDNSFEMDVLFSHNFIDLLPGTSAQDRFDGTPNSGNQSEIKGIYLDAYSAKVSADSNYVTGADYGIHIHAGNDNTLTNNTLFGNNKYQIWMQEDACYTAGTTTCQSLMHGNTVSGNTIATAKTGPLVDLVTAYASTTNFSSFLNNQYAQYAAPFAFDPFNAARFALDESGGSGQKNLTFAQWKSLGRDVTGSTLSSTVSSTPTALANQLTNGSFRITTNGWSYWPADAGFQIVSSCGHPVSENCLSTAPGQTASAKAAATSSTALPAYIVYTTQPLNIQPNHRYALSFDAKAEVSGSWLWAVLLDAVNYISWSNGNQVALPSSWTRYNKIFTLPAASLLANHTVRLDLELHSKGKVYLDNIRLVDITDGAISSADNTAPMSFYNYGSTAKTINCPLSDASLCQGYMNLRTQQAVTFPLTLAGKSSIVLTPKDTQFLDTDHDGVAGDGNSSGTDLCPNTPAGDTVDDRGCGITQTPVR